MSLGQTQVIGLSLLGIPDAKRGGDGFQPSYSVHKYNNLVRTHKITPSKSKSPCK